MAEEILSVGTADGLRFELALDAARAHGRDHAWGAGRVWLGDETVWFGEADDGSETAVRWTWLDLLEFLADAWPWLLLEQTYPIPVSPLYPLFARREAERRWEDLAESQVEAEEETLYRFELRHDLALGMKGIFLPSLLLLRQGQQFMVSSAATGRTDLLPYEKVVDTLTAVGDGLAGFVDGSGEARTRRALERWRERHERVRAQAVPLLGGIDVGIAARWAGELGLERYWELDTVRPERDSEILAAARMSGQALPGTERETLMERIRAARHHDTPELNALAGAFSEEFEEVGRPHEQGYWAAGWLRRRLGLDLQVIVEPRELLLRWGVHLEAIELPSAVLDAIAVWGHRHGPAIWLNRAAGARCTHMHGERTTLAHEICHLLVDRDRALPVGEVLGGAVPEYAEKRARAFAAELLLPREAAAGMVREMATIQTAVDALVQRYVVSVEVAVWQIRNSGIHERLGLDERVLLDSVLK